MLETENQVSRPVLAAWMVLRHHKVLLLLLHVDRLRNNITFIDGIYSPVMVHVKTLLVNAAVVYHILSSRIVFVEISQIVRDFY